MKNKKLTSLYFVVRNMFFNASAFRIPLQEVHSLLPGFLVIKKNLHQRNVWYIKGSLFLKLMTFLWAWSVIGMKSYLYSMLTITLLYHAKVTLGCINSPWLAIRLLSQGCASVVNINYHSSVSIQPSVTFVTFSNCCMCIFCDSVVGHYEPNKWMWCVAICKHDLPHFEWIAMQWHTLFRARLVQWCTLPEV